MINFAILIPFRPKIESANWDADNELLGRTIGSVLRQTYVHFKIYVLYTDAPTEKISDERVHYVLFPYGYQSWDDLLNRELLFAKFKSEKKAVWRWDKGRKLSYGSKLAKEDGADYIMALDSDDLLSKYFLAYLVTHSNEKLCMGWYMDKGFLYKKGDRTLIRVPRHMTGLNGSTHVLKADLVSVPDFASLEWNDFNLFTDHGWLCRRVVKEFGVKLEAIQKPLLVYVVHESNMSLVHQKEYGFHVKAIVKRIFRTILLTRKLRDEFFL